MIKQSIIASVYLSSFCVQAVTFQDVVSKTIDTNPNIRSSYAQYMSKYFEHEGSYGLYRPSLDLDAGVGVEHIDPNQTGGDYSKLNRSEATFSISQLIWNGHVLNEIDRADAEERAAYYQFKADAQDIILETVKAYIAVLESEEVLNLAEINLDVHRTLQKDINKRVKAGLGSLADKYQTESRVAKAESNLVIAKNYAEDSKARFVKVVGDFPTDLEPVQLDSQVLDQVLASAVEGAFQVHPVALVAQMDIEAAKFQLRSSEGKYLPSFSVEGSQTYGNNLDGVKGSRDEAKVMLRMRWNLYNGGQDVANVDKQSSQLSKAQYLQEHVYRQVAQSYELALSSYELNKRKLDYLSAQVRSSEITLASYKKQYTLGRRTLLDILNTENELFEAKKELAQAFYAEKLAQYQLLDAGGRLFEGIGTEISEKWSVK